MGIFNEKEVENYTLEEGAVERSIQNIECVLNIFRLIERKEPVLISDLISRDLVIRKNTEKLNYNQTIEYVKSLNDEFEYVRVFPFHLVLSLANQVVAKFTQTLCRKGQTEPVTMRYISIFTINEGKVSEIDELVIPVASDNSQVTNA